MKAMTDKELTEQSYIFNWKGCVIKTNRDLISAIENIKEKRTANKFLEIASKHQPWVIDDIKYICGYFDPAKGRRIWILFSTANTNAWYRAGLYFGGMKK